MSRTIRRALVPAVALGLVLTAQPAYAGVTTTPDATGQAAGVVYALVDAGDRTIVGGRFTNFGNKARANVAAVNADGTVDLAWDPGTDGRVEAAAVSEDGSTVYLGGTFTTVGGQPRANLAAVDAVTGEVLAGWSADTGGTYPDVNSLAVAGDRLYVAGRFGSIDGTTRKRLVALDAGTGDLITSFRPAPSGGGVREVVVSPDGTKLYVGGGFSAIGGAERPASAAELDASTGTATAFNPNESGGNVVTVEITPDGSRFFYSKGNNMIFAYDPAVSNDPVWRRKFSGNTQAMAAGPSGELYMGGHFSQDLTSKTQRAYFASVYYDTGALTSWDVAATGGRMGVWALLVDGDKLHAGGAFNYIGAMEQRGYARFSGVLSGNGQPDVERQAARVIRVVNGDTVKVDIIHGPRATVRLLGIDAPEVHAGEECYGPEASRVTRRMLPRGTRVRLTSDATQDFRDRSGRLLRYVTHAKTDVGHRLVHRGAARVYVHDHDPFRRVEAYRDAQRSANTHNRGLWGAC